MTYSIKNRKFEEKKENTDVYLLPEKINKIKDEFFFRIGGVRVQGVKLQLDNGKDKSSNNKAEAKDEKDTPFSVVEEYPIPQDVLDNNLNKFAYIEYSLNTVISKREHVYIVTLTKAYNNFQILFDFSNTDILKCSVYHSFQNPI